METGVTEPGLEYGAAQFVEHGEVLVGLAG